MRVSGILKFNEGFDPSLYQLNLKGGLPPQERSFFVNLKKDGNFDTDLELDGIISWSISLKNGTEVVKEFGIFSVSDLKDLELHIVFDQSNESLQNKKTIMFNVIVEKGEPLNKLFIISEQILHGPNNSTFVYKNKYGVDSNGKGSIDIIMKLSDSFEAKESDHIKVALVNSKGEKSNINFALIDSSLNEKTVENIKTKEILNSEVLKITKLASEGTSNIIPLDNIAGSILKVKGRVVDETAKIKISNVQLIIFAKKSLEGSAEVISIITTDSQGNFSFNKPEDDYKSAYGVLSISPEKQLEIILNVDGTFQDFIWLVLKDVAATIEVDDCDCHKPVTRLPDMEDLLNDPSYAQDIGGACTNFTTPNRALEEFTYHSVVRTSDPEIYEEEMELLEDRLEYIDQRISSIQNQLSFHSPFQKDAIKFSPSVLSTLKNQPLPSEEQKNEGLTFDKNIFSKINVDISQLTHSKSFLQDKIFNPNVSSLRKELASLKIEKSRLERILKNKGRVVLNGDNPIDWDDSDGTLGSVQASTIAYGHILFFKQVWKAAGYSLGDLVYSLPLAPGQKKQIVSLDWDWSERAAREERLDYRDNLMNSMIHDRDINEIVKANVAEGMTANSHSKNVGNSFGVGAGYGSSSSAAGAGSKGGFSLIGAFTNMLGISGGYNKSSGESWSDASQSSFRNTSAFSNQQLRDRTMQNASSVRSQRSSVVSTVGQNESFNVTTEVVANHNHCHAITIQYFEVLRHFAIHQELSDVQECLFIPFMIEPFDRKKILRWRDILSSYLLAPLDKINDYQKGFDALQREENAINGDFEAYIDFPAGKYCEENIINLFGNLKFNMFVVRPQHTLPQNTNPTYEERRDAILSSFNSFGLFWWPDKNLIAEKLANLQAEKIEENFQKEIIWTKLPESYLNGLRVKALLSNGSIIDLDMDITITSKRVFNDKIVNNSALSHRTGEFELVVSLRPKQNTLSILNSLARQDIKSIKISNSLTLPVGSYTMLVSGNLDYRTNHYSDSLFSSNSINNDIAFGDSALIFTNMNKDEQRNPRKEDETNSTILMQHLNSNKEYYHKILWYLMDEQRLFNLLDKYYVNVPLLKYITKDINGASTYGISLNNEGKPDILYEKRSVASVVELKRMGMAGNSMIFPVSRGNNLNEEFILIPEYEIHEFTERGVKHKIGIIKNESKLDLIELYKPLPGTNKEPKPFRVSVPTKGLFAEAVMGACNSCEKIDDTRFWKWEEHPIDEPTQIIPIDTSSRVKDAQDLTAKDFPSPMINIQNAPSAPDPVGIASALQLLGKSDIFKDLTGLDQNQKNALQAMLSNQESAKFFAEQATKLATEAGKNTQHAADTVAAYDLAKGEQKMKMLDKIKNLPVSSETKQKMINDAVSGILSNDNKTSDKLNENLTLDNKNKSGDILSQAAAKAITEGKDVKASKTDSHGNIENIEVKGDRSLVEKDDDQSTLGGTSDSSKASVAKKLESETALLRYINNTTPKTIRGFVPKIPNLEIGNIKPFDLDIKNEIKWGHILYIAGDNNLSDFALKDLIEMQNGSLDKSFSTLCLFDLKDNNGLYIVEINDNKINLLERWVVNKDNDLDAITVFLSKAIATYRSVPVKILGFWGHGSTAYMFKDKELNLRDLALLPDDNTDAKGKEKNMLLVQIKNCIQQSLMLNQVTFKFNALYFDCCLLQTCEIGSDMSNFAEYQIGSEETVPGNGQDYALWIREIVSNNLVNSDAISKAMVLAYKNTYQNNGNELQTFSAIDLSKVSTLATKLAAFCNAMLSKSDAEFKPLAEVFYKAINKTLQFPFDPNNTHPLTSPVSVTVDVLAMMDNFLVELAATTLAEPAIKTASEDVVSILSQVIIENFADKRVDGNPAGEEKANGLAIWYAKRDSVRNTLKGDMSINKPRPETEIADRIAEILNPSLGHYPNIDFIKNSKWLDLLARFYKTTF
jgi:hypothetical protein